MFESILRFYEKNKKTIITTILVCIVVILVIQIMNLWAKQAPQNTTTKTKQEYIQTEAIINDKKISSEIARENKNIIEDFVNYCNNGKIEDAYELISDDCKEVNFENIENFKNEYYNIIFKNPKLYTAEIWYSLNSDATYKVDFTDNPLHSGGAYDETYTDYITLIRDEENNIKLNILGFIRKKELNKIYEDENIKIDIKSKIEDAKDIIYIITFNNKTNGDISLYNNKNSASWYVTDNFNNKYYADINDILELKRNEEKNIQVKFNKTYNPEKATKSINFKNIQINGDLYLISIDF